MSKVGIIGAGAMGTAVSQTIAQNTNVLLYARREEVCNDINSTRINSQYFPNVNKMFFKFINIKNHHCGWFFNY